MTEIVPSRELIRLAKVGLIHDRTDGRHCDKLAELAKSLLTRRWHTFFHDIGSAPCAMTYGSDCTPEIIHETFTHSFEHLFVRRRGQHSGEYLIQRGFGVDADGKQVVLFVEPRLMASKTAWAH